MTIKIQYHDFKDNFDDRWRVCVWCGGTDNDGTTSNAGRMHPEHKMVKHQGKWYCKEHYVWRFKKQWEDDADITIKEEGSR